MLYGRLLLLVTLLAGCATADPQPTYRWTQTTEITSQLQLDTASCEARGYEVAGPRPQYRAPPECGGGFACGYQKGRANKSHRLALDAWKTAYTSGFDSCMYRHGYSKEPIGH